LPAQRRLAAGQVATPAQQDLTTQPEQPEFTPKTATLAQQDNTLQTSFSDPNTEFEENSISDVEKSREKDVDISRTYDRIKAENDVITDGSHIENGKLKSNVTYQTGEHAYLYQTNSDGLIEAVYVEDLQFKIHDGRLEHNRNTFGKQVGDHAGHLIGDQFGGSADLDNLVSQKAFVNLSEYRKLENQWAKAKRAGQSVSVSISIKYETDSTRPKSFAVEFTIDGVYQKVDIDNS